ncbi:hypothetical protein ACFCV3_28295 [Kribbella sp. NPDC056345]|uniref:hypothetical protein n=1 Tax=Kribbella sp. NPDC056345 TaxID=3345789 RepID=UPI0035D6F523
MAVVMGESSAEVWAEEYRRVSRVEFRSRATPYRREMVALQFLTAILIWLNLFVMPDRLWLFLVTLVASGRVAWVVAQLVGNRLLLLVDANGIRYGKTRLEWGQIGAIGVPHQKTLAIIPVAGKARPLTIRHWAVQDMPALAGWLEELLKQHRANLQGDSHADHG